MPGPVPGDEGADVLGALSLPWEGEATFSLDLRTPSHLWLWLDAVPKVPLSVMGLASQLRSTLTPSHGLTSSRYIWGLGPLLTLVPEC